MAEWSKPLCKFLQIAQWVTVTSPLGRTFLAAFFVALNANKTDLEIFFFSGKRRQGFSNERKRFRVSVWFTFKQQLDWIFQTHLQQETASYVTQGRR